jgi:hypothetical protein
MLIRILGVTSALDDDTLDRGKRHETTHGASDKETAP